MATHLLKTKLDKDLRMMEIPSPPRFDALVKAVAEAYALSETAGLTFTYQDVDGDQVLFDTDGELGLAVRTSSVPLRIIIQRPSANQQHRQPTTAVAGGRAQQLVAPLAAVSSSAAVEPAVPSTPGFPVASNVGSVDGDDMDEDDLILIDFPGEAERGVLVSGHSSGAAESPEDVARPIEIDPPRAFEVEAAAARDPEASMLYQKASLRLAKRHGVHLTPTQLWRVMALFQLQGRQLVIWGLAPYRALDANATDEEKDQPEEKDNGEKRSGRGSRPIMAARRHVASPVHSLLELNGVVIPEEEVVPLMEALRIRPRKLMKQGLLSPEDAQGMPEHCARGMEPMGPRGPGWPSRHMHHGSRHGRCRGRGGDRNRPHPPHFFMPPHMGGYPGHPPPHMAHAGASGAQDWRPHPMHMNAAMYGAPPAHVGEHPHGPPPYGPPPMGGGPPHGHPHGPPHGHPHGPPGAHADEDGLPQDEKDWNPAAFGAHAEMHMSHPPPPGPHSMWYRMRHVPGAFGFGHGGRGGGGRGGKESMAMVRFVEHRSPAVGSDVAHVAPGQSFKKSWLVRNDSSTTWPEDVSLVPVSRSCEELSSPPETPAVGGVAPGEETEVSVDLTAPSLPGMYEGFWRTSGGGRRFGQRLWAKVMVAAPGSVGAAKVTVGVGLNAGVEKLSLDDGNKDK